MRLLAIFHAFLAHTLLFASLWCGVAFAQAQTIPEQIRVWVSREAQNTYFENAKGTWLGETEVNPIYQVASNSVMQLKYIDIPVTDLTVYDSGLGSPELRKQILIEHEGKKYFRYFVHPESEELYAPLFKRYPHQGHYFAIPTSSTRSLFVWSPEQPENVFIAKTSLNKKQGGLNRIIPAWEVRRSIQITKQLSEDFLKENKKMEDYVIPEVMGAYIKSSENLGVYVDGTQQNVFEHGLIIRDISAFTKGDLSNVYPFFAILSKQGDQDPLIIQWWKESHLPWEVFLRERIIDPVLSMISELTFGEGMIPQFHTQNFLIQTDPVSRRIIRVFHRDIGSFGVDLRARWIKGLNINHLRTPVAHNDFKFEWSEENYYRGYLSYFSKSFAQHSDGFGKELMQYVPGYNYNIIEKMIYEAASFQMHRHWGIQRILGSSRVDWERNIVDYYRLNQPNITANIHDVFTLKKVEEFIEASKQTQTSIRLNGWKSNNRIGYRITPYGVVHYGQNGEVYLSLYTENPPAWIDPAFLRLECNCDDALAMLCS